MSSNDLMVIGFDYSALTPEEARETRDAAQRVRDRMQASIIETGRDLASVKARLGHGRFGSWLAAEFGMTERTAQNYMQAAAQFGGIPEIVSVLPASTLYALAAKSAPEAIRADVIRQVQKGSRPTPAEIGERLRQHKQAEAERQKAERHEAEIAKLSPEERAEREQRGKRNAKSRAKREEERKRQDEKWKAERRASEQAAQEAVELIAQHLGSDLDRFAALHKQAGFQFDQALNSRAVLR